MRKEQDKRWVSRVSSVSAYNAEATELVNLSVISIFAITGVTVGVATLIDRAAVITVSRKT
jgi:hypothetical protein